MNDNLQSLVNDYKMSPETVGLVQSTPIVLLVGVAGAGKDSIKHELLKMGAYHEIVSHTTRKPRMNNGVLEQEGISYHFIDLADAKQMLKSQEFVEAKLVHDQDIYGTSIQELRQAKADDKIALTDLDVQGVAEYKAISQNVVALFILPPSYEEWQRRLRARYGDKDANRTDLEKRMHTAVSELKEALSQPYYHFIVNDNLSEAVEVADKIAHGGDEFTRVDRGFRGWAEKLLADLSANS